MCGCCCLYVVGLFGGNKAVLRSSSPGFCFFYYKTDNTTPIRSHKSIVITVVPFRYDWSSKVTDILGPHYRFIDNLRTTELTVRDLLSHRTGLARLDIAIVAGVENRSRTDFCKYEAYFYIRIMCLYSFPCTFLTNLCLRCKNIRRFYSKRTGNRLPLHFPLFYGRP